jgi:1,2-phenylacetyl-CoA epoxidase PaaB subunit
VGSARLAARRVLENPAIRVIDMEVFEVLQRRQAGDELAVAGSILAPDLEMARLLARETHFRHAEATECYIRHGETLVPVADTGPVGGSIDRTYRRQEGYVGVGARMRRLAESLQEKGLRITGARPSDAAGSKHA